MLSARHHLVVAKLNETMKPKVRFPKFTTFEIDVMDWESVLLWSEAFGQRLEARPFSKSILEKNPLESVRHVDKQVLWKVVYRRYEEFSHLFSKRDCCRNFGKQCTYLLLHQTTAQQSKQQPFEITLVGKKLYSYETSDSFGLDLIPSSITFEERYYLTFKYQLCFSKIEIKNKIQ